MKRLYGLGLLAAAMLMAGCGAGDGESSPRAGITATVPAAEPTATSPPSPTATPEIVRQDIRAERLVIPSLGIDEPVQGSERVPSTYTPPPGCPPREMGEETVTVPATGIATPADNLPGLENKAWIYGHSRWLGVPGIFFSLQELDLGDELLIDGVERDTGERLEGVRFVVNGLYLADFDSGGEIINADGPEDIPPEPLVILQTSVRADGAGQPWILDREPLMAKVTNMVEGDVDDPCKYLLLFVTARRS